MYQGLSRSESEHLEKILYVFPFLHSFFNIPRAVKTRGKDLNDLPAVPLSDLVRREAPSMIPFLTHAVPRSSIFKGCIFPAPNRLSFPSPYVFVYVCTCIVYKFIVFPVKYSSMRHINYSKTLHETCRLRVFRVYETGEGEGLKATNGEKITEHATRFVFRTGKYV